MADLVLVGSAVFCAVGLVALLMGRAPRLRGLTSTVMPLVLGVSCLMWAAALLPSHQSWPELFWPPASASAWTVLAGAAICAATAYGGFQLERWLLSLRRRRALSASLPPALQYASLPSRAESMRGVAEVAQRPTIFWALSAVSVLGEEVLFRAAFLTVAEAGGFLVVGLVLQAGFFALNHIGFGSRTVAAKAVVGSGLGVGFLSAGLLTPVIVHLLYQALVFRQFRPQTQRGR